MISERPGYEVWKDWSAGEFGKFSAQERAYYEAEIFRQIGPNKSADILEVGFGNGGFLGCARELGHRVTGVELNVVLRDRAIASGFRAVERLDEFPSAVFDAIVAMDVLEHVPDGHSVELIASMRRVLRPGGLIFLRFPNGDSPFGRALQYGDMTHVSVVGTIKIRYIAQCAGLEVLSIENETSVVKGLPMSRLLKRLVRKTVHFCVEWVLGIAFFGTRRPLGQNLMVKLRKPPSSA